MKPKQIKKILLSEIELLSNNVTDYIRNPRRDFSRNRKLPFSTIIKSIIGMESKSLTNELIDFFNTSDLPSASAFVQQRLKIKTRSFQGYFRWIYIQDFENEQRRTWRFLLWMERIYK